VEFAEWSETGDRLRIERAGLESTMDRRVAELEKARRTVEERAEVVPPQLYTLSIRTWTRTRLAYRLRPPVNLVLSNVPGPTERLAVGGAVLDALYSVGPILEGIGCNITAWSYAGNLYVSLLGCPRSLPDPWQLAVRLALSLEELKRGVLETASGGAAPH